MAEYLKPLPHVDGVSRPYWDAARRHQLMLQRCRKCGAYRYPAGEACSSCLSDDLEWVKATGRGEVYTFTVFHQVYHPAFAGDVPYVVAAIELEEGPRMIASLVGCTPPEVRIGMPVEVVFDDVTAEVTLPRFRPRR
jgi:hypothetical protein